MTSIEEAWEAVGGGGVSRGHTTRSSEGHASDCEQCQNLRQLMLAVLEEAAGYTSEELDMFGDIRARFTQRFAHFQTHGGCDFKTTHLQSVRNAAQQLGTIGSTV